MTEPVRLSSAFDALDKPCPYCDAKPWQPCRTPNRHASLLGYTHAERNH